MLDVCPGCPGMRWELGHHSLPLWVCLLHQVRLGLGLSELWELPVGSVLPGAMSRHALVLSVKCRALLEQEGVPPRPLLTLSGLPLQCSLTAEPPMVDCGLSFLQKHLNGLRGVDHIFAGAFGSLTLA